MSAATAQWTSFAIPLEFQIERLPPPLESLTDADGLPDFWETTYFPGAGANPNDNPDLDGAPNLQEYRAGTHPTDANSVLHRHRTRRQRYSRRLENGRRTHQSTPGRNDPRRRGFFRHRRAHVCAGQRRRHRQPSSRLDMDGATNRPACFYRVRLLP
jgi:hypothetical protein